MASDEVQPVTAQQPIEGELLNVLTMSKEQILNLISTTHLPDEEKFEADYSLLVAVEHERAKYLKSRRNYYFQSESNEEDMEEKMSIASCFALLGGLFQFSLESLLFAFGFIKKSFIQKEKDVEKPKEKGQENLEEKVFRLRDSFNPQLLCILDQLSSEMACKAPSVEVIMSILNKLSNYSWEAKLLLILASYGLNSEDFLDIPNNAPATLKHQNLQQILSYDNRIDTTLHTMKYFLKVKKVTKDEPALLSDVAGDIPVGVYWIIVTCTTHMSCLTGDEDKTQDISLLNDKIHSFFFGLGSRIRKIEKMYTRRKLKELFPREAMQPLIDGSTNEQVSIDVLKEKNILLFISGLNIHRNDKSDLMSVYDGIKKKGDQYKIVWIPIVEQWTNNLRRKFEMLQSKMPWYIVQYFSVVVAIKFIEEWYDNKPIVWLMNPQGDVENEDALYLIRRYGMSAFPFTPFIRPVFHTAYWRTPGPYEIEEYTLLYGGKDKRWIEQFSQMENVVAEDQLMQEVNILINFSFVGRKSKDLKELGLDKEIQKLAGSFKNDSRWAVLIMTNDSKVISKDGTTILQVLEVFEEWKVNVRERGFQICFKEYHDRLLPTSSQPSASRNV